jgi:HlyD family secretion protein
LKKRRALIFLLAVVVAVVVWSVTQAGPEELVLTGIVTTNDVVVSPQIAGRVASLVVAEGDTVAAGDLLATIEPDELREDSAYYAHSADALASQVEESQAALRYEEQQTWDQVRQAEANLAATRAQQHEAAADLERAQLDLKRAESLAEGGIVATERLDSARTDAEAATAHLDSLARQVEAHQSALALVKARAEQVAVKKSQLEGDRHRLAAASAQQAKAEVRLGYTEVRAPISGLVNVSAVRQGEMVTTGQPMITLVDPDDLWVRGDVEETYIESIHIGDQLQVRLPSGVERTGTVFFRGVDAGFATQRDVSRRKRDIKTFEIRLRLDNSDRRLAVGMTAYVLLPVSTQSASL